MYLVYLIKQIIMHSILKNILAILLGFIIGSIVNMLVINMGHSIFPIAGIDINNLEVLSKIMPTLDFNYFIFPFLAHALGTLVGAFVAYSISDINKTTSALAIGIIFLLGGITANYLITGPIWFTITDLLLAYIPMAWIGKKIAQSVSKK